MSNWVPEGSVAYGSALADEGYVDRLADDTTVPWFSTAAPKPIVKRSAKKCIANAHTCGGWKAKDTDYCVGHLAAKAKEAASNGS